MVVEKLPSTKVAIYQRFCREAARVEALLLEGERAYAAGDHGAASLLCHLALIRLNDSWSKFSRRLLVASALGLTGFSGKHPKAPNISDEASAMAALGIGVPWREDWAWHVASTFLGAARKLKVTNINTLNGSMGATPNPSESVRFIRNFFAHSNPDTFRRAIGACGGLRPVDFCFTAHDRGTLRVLVWLEELRMIARLACD